MGSRNLIAAIELLYALGALDDRGELSQPLGEQMSELPIHPTLAKMLLSSGEMGCSQEIVTIIAMLQVENVFVYNPGQADKAKIAKRKFEVEEGDLLTLLNVYYAFHNRGGSDWSKSKHWSPAPTRRSSSKPSPWDSSPTRPTLPPLGSTRR